MAQCRDFIVVLVSDAGLRTSLIARLGMTGKMVVTAHDHRALARWRERSAASTLIIDIASLPTHVPVEACHLRAQVWSGRMFVVGDQNSGDAVVPPIRFVEPATATSDIMAGLESCA